HHHGDPRAEHCPLCGTGSVLCRWQAHERRNSGRGLDMRWLDIFIMALQAVIRNKFRSFLTTLGIIIGVGSVVAMVHLGQSATQTVTNEIASIGSNLLFVIPGSAQRGPGGLRTTAESFDLADVE